MLESYDCGDMTALESTLLAEARIYLGTLPAAMFIRINTGVFKPLYGEQKRVIRSAPNGTPDLLGRYRFIPVAIETKSAKGKQRKAQQDFEREWTRDGYGVYLLPRSLEELQTAIERLRSRNS